MIPEAPAADGGTDALPGGRGTGIFLHRLLEEINPATVHAAAGPATWIASPAVRQLARRIAEDEGLPLAAVEPACQLVWNALRTPLHEQGLELPEGLCAVTRRSVEMELLFPIPETAHPRLGEVATSDDRLAFKLPRQIPVPRGWPGAAPGARP